MRIIIKGSTKWPMFLSVCLTLRKNQKQAMSKSLPIIIIIIIIITSNNQRLVKCVRFQRGLIVAKPREKLSKDERSNRMWLPHAIEAICAT